MNRPAIAIALIALVLLPAAGWLGLTESTETRYAEVAREMRATGEWIVPRLEGIAHFTKPPLTYWITALGFAALGENAWGARIPAALAVLLTLALVARTARRGIAGVLREKGPANDFAGDRGARGPARGDAGVRSERGPSNHFAALSVWVLGSSVLFASLGRALSPDTYLTTCVAAFWCFAGSPVALAALGVGFMIKGPVVLVPTVLPVLLVALWERLQPARAHALPSVTARLGPWWGWLLCGAIAIPWFAIVSARVPGLMRYFLEHEVWQRYASEVHDREGHPAYFVVVLALGLLPWTAALMAGLIHAWRDRARRETKLLLAWLIVPLMFLSFSGSKLPGYLLPCMPAAAMLAALGLARGGRYVHVAVAMTLAALAIAGATLGPAAWARLAGASAGTAFPLPAGLWVALGALLIAAIWSARNRPELAALTTLAALTVALVAIVPYERFAGSPRPIARVLAEHRVPGETVVVFRRANSGLSFYLRETVLLLEVPRELRFDSNHGAGRVIQAEVLPALARRGRVWILGPEADSRALAERTGLDYRNLTTWSGSTLGFLSLP